MEYKALAFKKIINTVNIVDKLEDVINDNYSVDEDSLPYEEGDFGLGPVINGKLRDKSGLKMLTVNILQTYKEINSNFIFEETKLPRRVLTSPEEGVNNNGKDNSDNNLIVYVQDEIRSPNAIYIIIDLIGQVFKCTRQSDEKLFALKIIKNKKAYKSQALIELKILEYLNTEIDKNDMYHIIRIFDYFFYHEHLCIVFELLNENIYQLLQHNHLQGLSLNSIRFITKQILEAVYQLQKANLIHCDLKPENILLKIDKDNPKGEISIKVTDFGSSCFKNHTMFPYIQSRYYRAPEVIVGIRYSTEIDIWSIGCIVAELYLGTPLLPGSCEYDQLCMIQELLGELPVNMINGARNSKKYYKFDPFKKKFNLKSADEYFKDYPTDMKPKYKIPEDLKCLDDLINVKKEYYYSKKKEYHNHSSFTSSFNNDDLAAFVHFLKGLLTIDPKLRWNAKQCLRHPFITREKFDTFFNLNPEEVSQFLYLTEGESHGSDLAWKYYLNLGKNKYNWNNCNSMIINFNQQASNNNSSYNNLNSSVDAQVYQPNLEKIQLKWMRNFPFAKVAEIDFNPLKKVVNKYDQSMNHTFMMTSFERINPNNSYMNTSSDMNFFKQKMRVLKNEEKNNKYSKLSQNMYRIKQANDEVMVLHDEKMYGTIAYSHLNQNKSQFNQMNPNNIQEYNSFAGDGNQWACDRSYDYHKRERSKSDYNQNTQVRNFRSEVNKQQQCNINYHPEFSQSTSHQDIMNINKSPHLKYASSKETPVVNNKKCKNDCMCEFHCQGSHEIQEEELQGDDELNLIIKEQLN